MCRYRWGDLGVCGDVVKSGPLSGVMMEVLLVLVLMLVCIYMYI